MSTARRMQNNIVMIQGGGDESIRRIKHANLLPNEEIRETRHAADAFTNISDIELVVRNSLETGNIRKAVMFIVGINTGYRCGDLVSLRVSDVTDCNGDVKDVLYIVEQKTGKSRAVYFNEAARTAIKFIIEAKGLKMNDFLFSGDGNRKAYLDGFRYDSEGCITDVIITSNRWREDGTEREVAPMAVSSVGRWLKSVTKALNIAGHYSSHAMRKTFSEFISRDWDDNRNPNAAAAALNHASVDTTAKYYMGIHPSKLRSKWMSLNLGLRPLEEYIEGTNMCKTC